ncbi:MAG TPA: acetate/propionate family kinase [Acidimicrobiales bacterium]|nr:acetate/propionate family kinase [Acidimicrobiales bacterium]
MRVLVVNAGSSSLKLRVVDERDATVAAADLPPVHDLADGDLGERIAALGPCDAAGHRVVHGGEEFRAPVVVDRDVRDRLGALAALAPLHQPHSLAALDAVSGALPGVPAVACFDTAFHATLPPAAATFPVPAEWRHDLGLRRYGFHGLSHAYAARRAGEMAPRAHRVVTCHLGAGASLAAVRDGRSVDTTMGFTPLDGLVMATRSGALDPGAVLWLVTEAHLDPRHVAAALERASGLVGLAGTADMREVTERAAAGDGDATLALEVYVHRLRAAIAAMVAALGGLDALVFTGGVGENSAAVRAAAAGGLGFLGVVLDPADNAAARPDVDVTGRGSQARVLVIAAREEVEIARGTRGALAERPANAG